MHNIPYNSFSHDRNGKMIIFFKVLPLGNDKKNSRPLALNQEEAEAPDYVQVDIKMETEPLFCGDRNINTCTNL